MYLNKLVKIKGRDGRYGSPTRRGNNGSNRVCRAKLKALLRRWEV